MTSITRYVNSDLDLKSADDLAPLVAAFQAADVFALHVTLGDDGVWFAVLETETQYDEPEPNIAAMLAVVEALAPTLRSVWAGCSRREFNVGYDCGVEPWAFNQGLSAELLGRMAVAGASLRWTLYPDREQGTPNQRLCSLSSCSRLIRIPRPAIPDDRVGDHHELPGDCHQHYLVGLPLRPQPQRELSQSAIDP